MFRVGVVIEVVVPCEDFADVEECIDMNEEERAFL